MPPTSLSAVVRQVRKLAAPGDTAAASDAHLLDRFRASGDEAAFATLVRRHGPLVMGVCRRVLRHHQDAEDAFQATFLVLARKAAAIRRRTALASWLYGVARRVAGDARRAAARRQARERRATDMGHAQPDLEAAWRELQAVLAQEVERLPQKYQLPFVLCCLEGRSKAEAAVQLGWKEGTVSSRLAEARKRMQQRLARRGLTLTAALCAVAAAADTASALSSALVTTTVRAARGAWTGTAAGASARVAALANGVTKTLFASKVKAATALLLVLGLLGAVGTQIHRAFAGPPAVAAAPPEEAKAAGAAASKPAKAEAPADPLPAGAVLRLGSTRLRHGTSVSQLALSPDGTQVAAYGDGQLSLWDTRTGGALRRVGLPAQADRLGQRLERFQASLAWLADGRGIVMLQGSDTRDVARLQGSDGLVWEFTDEKAVPKIPPHWGVALGTMAAQPDDNESDWCYAVSPDGKTLAVGRGRILSKDVGPFSPIIVGAHPAEPLDKDRAILLRPLKTGAAVSELPAPKELAGQPGNCKALLFTPDGKRLVAFNQVKDGHQVFVRDLATGKEIARFKAPRPTVIHPGEDVIPAQSAPRRVAVSDATLAIALESGDTGLWDLATGKERNLATDHVPGAPWQQVGAAEAWRYTGTTAVAFAPDGKTLATGGRDGLVKLWDVASGRRLRTLEQQYTPVEALAWSRDGRTVASAGRDGVIRLWDAATGKDLCPQPGHRGGVFRTVLSPDGKTAVTAGWDRTVRCWDTATGRELRVLAGFVNELAVSPDSRTVLASVPEGGLRTWDLATGRETTPTDLPNGLKFGALAFTPDGRRLVTASGPHVTVLDWPRMKVRLSFDLPKPDKQPKEYECKGLAVSPDGTRLVTVAERSGWRSENPPSPAGGVVDLWDLGTGRRVRRLAEWLKLNWNFQPATMAAFTADGQVILAPGTGTIPAQGGRPEQPAPGRPVDPAEFNNYTGFLITRPSQGWAALLDPTAPRWLQSFAVGEWHYYTAAIALSPDGRTLYLSYDTSQIVAFEVATGKVRRTLNGHAGCVRSLAMAPDGRRLLSVSDDAFGLLWDTTPAGAAKPRKEPLTEADADGLWTKLAGDDAGSAFAAMADLAAAPDRAVTLLRRELKPAPTPTDAEMDRLFADLDDDDFATREKASRRLAELGESAVPGVRKRLAKAESAEVRRRAQEFLDRFDLPKPSPDRLRQLRAVELLEGIATPAARDMLSELAKGAAEAPLSREAAAALERLRRR
jgi:RNA polymerase sigma factor (sigma-70 family)